jgi:hypothetical protein
MKISLPIFAVVFILASCSKNTPTPTPTPTQPAGTTLLAKWQVDSAWVNDTPNSPKSSLRTYPAQAVSWEFNSNEWFIYSGSAVDKRYTYTQKGSLLTINTTVPSQQIILALTAHRLVLQSTPDGYPTGTIARAYTTASR